MDLAVGRDYVPDVSVQVGVIDPYNQRIINTSFEYPLLLPDAIPPRRRWLLGTTEPVSIPAGYIGLICLRSTWARLGLMAPPTIADPGFQGYLTMEVFNSGTQPVIIRPGDYLWSMTMLTAPFESAYQGRYQDQPSGVTLPKALIVKGEALCPPE